LKVRERAPTLDVKRFAREAAVYREAPRFDIVGHGHDQEPTKLRRVWHRVRHYLRPALTLVVLPAFIALATTWVAVRKLVPKQDNQTVATAKQDSAAAKAAAHTPAKTTRQAVRKK
jgi:hypothetical protein